MPEVPVTRRYPTYATVLVASDIDSTDLQASVDAISGEGVLVTCDVISVALDSAR